MTGFPEPLETPVGVLLDLADERRAAKTGLPPSDKDVTEGRVVLMTYPLTGDVLFPACTNHGAMHALTIDCHVWRCSECGVGALYRRSIDSPKWTPYADGKAK